MDITKFQELKVSLGEDDLLENSKTIFSSIDVEDEENLLDIKEEYSNLGLFLCLYIHYTSAVTEGGHQLYQESFDNTENLFQNHKKIISLMKKYIEIDSDIKDSFLDILSSFKLVGETCYECVGSGIVEGGDCFSCDGTGKSLDTFIIEDLEVLDDRIADLIPDLNIEIEFFLKSI